MDKAENKAQGEETQASGTQAQDTNQTAASEQQNDQNSPLFNVVHDQVKKLLDFSSPDNGCAMLVVVQIDDDTKLRTILAASCSPSNMLDMLSDAFAESDMLRQAAKLALQLSLIKKMAK